MKRERPEEHTEMMKWALQTLYFDGSRWIKICRIDNYPHDKKEGSHIHIYGKSRVRMVNMTFNEAYKEIRRISSEILKRRFNEIIDITIKGGKNEFKY